MDKDSTIQYQSNMNSEENYQFMFMNNPQPMIIYDIETLGFLEVNNVAIEHYGYSRDEFLSMTIKDIRPIEDIPLLLQDIELSKTKINPGGTWRHLKKNGELIYVETSAYLVVFNNRNARHVLIRDVTEQTKVKNALQENEERFKQVAEFSGIWVWEIDADGLYTYSGNNSESVIGFKPEEIVGKKYFYDFFLPEEKNDLTKSIFDSFSKKLSFQNFTNLTLHKNGQIIVLETSAIPMLDKNGILLGYRGVDRDVTQRDMAIRMLQASEAKFATAFDKSPVLLTISEFETGKYLDVNEKFLEVSGFSRQEVIGKTSIEIGWVTKEDRESIIESFKTNNRVSDLELKLHGKGGKEIFCMYNAENLIIDNKRFLLSLAVDITKSRKVEEALRESEYFFKESQRAAFVGSYKTDFIKGFWESSEVLDQIFGIDKNYSRSIQGWLDIIHPEDQEMMSLYLNEYVIGKRRPFNKEYRIIRISDRETRWLLGMGKVDYDNAGNVISLIGTIQDITERKLAEEKLKDSEMLFKNLFENAADAIFIADFETGIILDANQTASKLMMMPVENIIGIHQTRLHPPAIEEFTKDSFKKNIEELEELNSTRPVETEILRSDGVSVPIEVLAANVIIKGKKCIMGTFRDITERKHNIELIRKNEERFRLMIKNSSDVIVMIDADGTQRYISPPVEKITGYSSEEVTGLSIADVIHPADMPHVMEVWNNAVSNPEKIFSVIYRHKHKTRKWIYLEAIGQSFLNEPSVNSVVVSVRDFSYRRQTELLQKVQYNIANSVVNSKSLADLFNIVQSELQKILDNQTFYIVLLDENTQMLHNAIHDDHAQKNKWPVANSLSGMVVTEGKSLFLSKTDIIELKILKNIDLIDEPVEYWMGVPLKIDHRIMGAMVLESHDPDYYFEKNSFEILEIVANQISLYIDKIKDEEDLIVAKEKAEESDRLKTEFLNNMSHEIRTPLNGIMGFTNLMSDTNSTPQDRDYYSRIVTRNVNQLASIIDDIISIATIEANQEKINEQPCDVHQLVVDLIEQFKKGVSSQVLLSFRFRLENQTCIVNTDQTKLHQMLSNLIGNAIKFTDHGAIQVTCELKDNYLQFMVSDTGIGIRPEFKEMIFERFRQVRTDKTKLYRGTGLGLAISKAYADLLGGRIWVESVPGKGSKFYFTIPYKPANPAEIKKEIAIIPEINYSSEASKTILIVEDEWSNFMLVNLILTQLGYKTIKSTSGLEAIDEFRRNPDIDLILMDLKLPEMTGYEATKVIKSERPTIPIIAITAYAQTKDREKALIAGCDDYITKPVTKEGLMNLISRYLR